MSSPSSEEFLLLQYGSKVNSATNADATFLVFFGCLFIIIIILGIFR